jgi:hypothetical protein
MALVMVLLATSCILVIASLVATKVLQSQRRAAVSGLQRKLYYAADAGVAHARKILDDSYVASGYWQDYLTGAGADSYRQSGTLSPGLVGASPPVAVTVWLRDNNDGDDDFGQDADLRVVLLAEATCNGANSRVEAVLVHDGAGGAGYGQLGGGARKTNSQDVTGIDDVAHAGDQTRTIRLQ